MISLSDATLIELKSQMGEELGTAFHFTWGQFTYFSRIFDQYVSLFSTAERRQLFDQSGAYFGHLVSETFFETMVLGLSRMLDPAEQGKGGSHKNMTLNHLYELCDATLKAKLDNSFKKLKTLSKSIEIVRNKVLAHTERGFATGNTKIVFPHVGELKSIFDEVFMIIKIIYSHFGTTVGNSATYANLDAFVVLRYLYWGQQRVQQMSQVPDSESVHFDIPDWLIPSEEEENRWS